MGLPPPFLFQNGVFIHRVRTLSLSRAQHNSCITRMNRKPAFISSSPVTKLLEALFTCICSWQCQSQKQMHLPRRDLCFFFTCRKKYMISYLHNHTVTAITAYESYSSWLTTDNLYILERLRVVSIAANESILAPLSRQTESLHPPHDMSRLGCFNPFLHPKGL